MPKRWHRAGYIEAEARGLNVSAAELSDDEIFALGTDSIAEMIHSIGMYRTKSANLLRLASVLSEKYGGEVPEDYDKLIELPGVGRKTANVVLAEGFGHQRIAVDTHVFRVANRIGLTNEKDVLTTEKALMERCLKIAGRILITASYFMAVTAALRASPPVKDAASPHTADILIQKIYP